MDIPMHLITIKNPDWFFSPSEMYFGYIIRTGKCIIENRGDFEFLTKRKQLSVLSFLPTNEKIEREITINSYDPKNMIAYFQYKEAIPYEITQIYKHKIISNIFKYCSLSTIIKQLNNLITLEKEFFNNEYLEWLDGVVRYKNKMNSDEKSKLRTLINIFSNSYITTLYAHGYHYDQAQIKRDEEKIIYKLYEMKYLNDIGMVKII
ncbi:MAG: hypothetical protein PWQ84_1506 [Thermotogaceae bacterium]|jgi:hypothetical protein|nr:hypothetical protein [Thermotogaceae bacterium]